MPLATPDVLLATNRARVVETVLRWMLHEARNPLQTLTLLPTLGEGAARVDELPEWREAVGGARDRLVAAVALLERLVGAGRGAPEPVALASALAFIRDLLHARRGRLQLDLSDIHPDLLPAVTAVPKHLDWVLINLALNAAEATADRDARLTMRARLADDHVMLELEDDGPGIDASVHPRLFQPYTTTKSDHPDRGLGLYAARLLLSGVGATIDYEPGPLERTPTVAD
ncbi:MAG TPA: ATP-binding protein [Gemmatimonadales bacterium]|nr:ATP-binding protein [Gemmatimonadales bacterium]